MTTTTDDPPRQATDGSRPVEDEPRTLAGDLRRIRGSLRRRFGRPALVRRARTTTTGRRVLLTAVASFVPVVVLALAATAALSRTATLTADVRDRVDQRIAPVLTVTDELGEVAVRLDRLFASGAAHDAAAFEAQARRVDAAFAPLVGEPSDDAPTAQRVAAAWDSWRFVRDTVTADGFVVPSDPGARTGLLATLATTLADVRADLRGLTGAATDAIVADAQDARATSRTTRALVIAGLLLSGLLGAALVSWLVRDLRRGIGVLVEAAERVREGSFDEPLPQDLHGDLAPVATAFNAMAERLERQRRELRGLASHDPLTGCLNRRAFEDELATELERAARYGHPTALLLLDVDHFKAVNDTLGHQAGDAVLQAVAEQVADAVRGVDRVARWGGEEFALLLPETDEGAARHVAERVVELVAQRTVLVGGRRVQVTVSIGVAVGRGGADGTHLVARADTALYAAKDGGRNQARVAS